MATELEQKPAPSATTKVESYVAQELEKVRGRVRLLDAGGWLLLFLVVTLGYGFVFVLLDRTLNLNLLVRLLSFLVYLGGAGFCLVQAGRCFLRRVNPYYAARQLEQTLPDTKNSIINWLDLRDEKLPPAIRAAVGTRAAKDLKQSDPERAVSSRLPLLLGALVLGLVLGLLVLFVMESHRFGDLMGRAFAPFRDIDLGTQTTITVIEPAGGDVTVAINRPVHFRAAIDGRIPAPGYRGSPRLVYRYNPAEPYDDRVFVPLEQDRDGAWTATMHADQVQSGFWYRITAGDAQTPEYQVSVRTFPLVTRYEVTYHYRPYRKIPDQSTIFPNENAANPSLKGHRGTEVTLIARTNRRLKDGHLEFTFGDARRDVAADMVPDDPQALRFHFVMEKTGTFRVLFTSKDHEGNSNPLSYPIEVLEDGVPMVQLTKPGKDIELEANRSLTVEGSASDDFGVKKMILQLRVLEGPEKPALAPLVHREGKSFQLQDGSFPRSLDYTDLIVLSKLKTAKGDAFPLAKGMVLEYWLEAIDNSDYPNKDGNVGRSKAFKITILDPLADQKKVEQERQQGEKQQEKHNQQQDKQIEKENQAKREPQPQDNNRQEDRQKQDELDKTGEKLKNDAEELEKAKRQQERDNQTGRAKGGEPEKSQSKEGGNEKKDHSGGPKDHKPQNQEQAGEQKNDGAGGQSDKAGQARDAGNKADKSAAQGKGADNQPSPSAKGSDDPKGSQEKQTNPSESAAGKEQPKEKDNAAAARDQGPKGDPKNNPAQAKEGGADGSSQPKAENKQPGKDQPGAQAKSEKNSPDVKQANPDETAGAKGQPKEKDNSASARDQGPKRDPKSPAQAKEGGADAAGQPKAENKPTAKEQPGAQAKSEKGAEGAAQPQSAKAEPKDGPQGGKDQIAQAKEQGKQAGKAPETGASKTGEQKTPREGANPGAAKQEDAQQPKSIAKNTKEPSGAGGQPKADAKPANATAHKGEPQGEPKQAEPGQIDKAAQAKERGRPDAKKELDPDAKKAAEHIAKLADKLRSPDKKTRDEALETLDKLSKEMDKLGSDDQKTRDEAAKELENIAKHAKDEDIREVAKHLAERRKQDAQTKGSDNPETKSDQGEPKNGDGDMGKQSPAQAKGPPNGKDPAKDDTATAKSEQPSKVDPTDVSSAKGGQQTGLFGPGAKGLPHQSKDWDPNADFNRRAGELNLEDLKNKITPEMRQRAGWTEEKWQKFLRDADAYNRELAKMRQEPNGPDPKGTAQGGTTKLPSTGPRQVRASDGTSNAQIGDALPPLEFRDIYRNLTRPDAAPPKK